MALRPSTSGSGYDVVDDVTGAVLSEGIPQDLLGSLASQGTPPPASPDLRVAELTPGQAAVQQRVDAPAAPPPSVSDFARGAQQADAATQARQAQYDQIAQNAETAQGGGSATGGRRLAGPNTPTPTNAQPAAAPAPTGPESSYSGNTEDELRKIGLGLMQPRPGVAVSRPAKNVLQNFKVEVAPKLTPEQREEYNLNRDLADVRQQRAIAEGGLLEGASHQDAAMLYAKQRQEAQAELTRIRDEERERDRLVGSRMRELDMLGEELRDKRKAAANPDAYWDDKGTFGTVLAKVGMFLYSVSAGLRGADPLGLAKLIDAEAERYNQTKQLEAELLGKEITHKENQLDRVRSRFISRDAAAAASKMLMLESMAAETASLAESYKSDAAKNGAQQLIAELQARSAAAKAQAELAEKDAITQAWRHDEAMKGVVGGSPGMNIFQVADKMFPGDPERVMKAGKLLGEGKLPMSKQDLDVWKASKEKGAGNATMQKFHEMGLIQLPEGGYAYKPYGAEKSQDLIVAMPALAANLREMRDIVKGVATVDKLSPNQRERLRTLASENAVHFKKAPKEALTTGELDALWNAMIGADINQIFRYGNEEAQLEQAARSAENIERTERKTFRKVPAGIDPGEPLDQPVQSTPEPKVPEE